ncbi:MAG: UDP-N-acetylglucosamine 1-carboxyvinyltransferase [Candidatus Levybacteria bacterium]|nr:UDP-N-acetylglucosamine 1-carboxyvinyltransferase [Candidatus Levybacteria bacterium]
MEKYTVIGGNTLSGTTSVSGAKNVALKALVASCLTEEDVVIQNIPLISDLHIMVEIINNLGGSVVVTDHTATVSMKRFQKSAIPLDAAAEVRTSSMFIAPLLARTGEALIPNPGGCRLGARPIDRTIDGLQAMGAEITYSSDDGFFHAKTKALKGITYRFEKNSHTATETMILAGVLAQGVTVLENAAEEPEVDELISLLKSMGASIKRSGKREITIRGVEKLHSGSLTVRPDRNEIVTLAVAAIVTKGDIFIVGSARDQIGDFLEALTPAGGSFDMKEDGIRFYYTGLLQAVSVTTSPHPGFMTDWQGPWALLMTQASGESVIHETVFENRFGYVKELRKMGAKIELFNPEVAEPKKTYNFNLSDDRPGFYHAARIFGPVKLHNGVVTISDIRAGATLVLAALAASGESTILGIEKLDRGYEQLELRLGKLGARISRHAL